MGIFWGGGHRSSLLLWPSFHGDVISFPCAVEAPDRLLPCSWFLLGRYGDCGCLYPVEAAGSHEKIVGVRGCVETQLWFYLLCSKSINLDHSFNILGSAQHYRYNIGTGQGDCQESSLGLTLWDSSIGILETAERLSILDHTF